MSEAGRKRAKVKMERSRERAGNEKRKADRL